MTDVTPVPEAGVYRVSYRPGRAEIRTDRGTAHICPGQDCLITIVDGTSMEIDVDPGSLVWHREDGFAT